MLITFKVKGSFYFWIKYLVERIHRWKMSQWVNCTGGLKCEFVKNEWLLNCCTEMQPLYTKPVLLLLINSRRQKKVFIATHNYDRFSLRCTFYVCKRLLERHSMKMKPNSCGTLASWHKSQEIEICISNRPSRFQLHWIKIFSPLCEYDNLAQNIFLS